jgi:PAS domain S-box-containing protein
VNADIDSNINTSAVIEAAMGKFARNASGKKTTVESGAQARTHYRDLLALYPQYAAVIQDLRPVLFNRQMLELAGCREQELPCVTFTDLCHPADRQAFEDLLRRTQDGKSIRESANLRFIDHGGKVRWLEIEATAIEWDKQPAGLLFAVENTKRMLADQELQQRHEHLCSVLRAVPDLLFEVDRDGRLFALPGAAGDPLPTEAVAGVTVGVKMAARTGRRAVSQHSVLREGERRWFEHTVCVLGDHRRVDSHFLVTVRDITQRKQLEEQGAHGKTMDAVGRLAGGIAHDFNNILQAILGFCNLTRERANDEAEVLRNVGVIESSVQRAASLTNELLAFSRTQTFQPVVRDMNDFLRNCALSLKRCLGGKVELVLQPADQPLWVNVDPTQLQQVLLNLAENARDSIQDRGTLTIEVHRVEMEPDTVGAPFGMPPGEYGLFLVRDTGIGMDGTTLSHIFEPFFTTKEVGTGSGLGLSIVYGTVRQMGGFIMADSVVGLGSSFRIYLPVIEEIPSQPPGGNSPRKGTETILLVSDEDAVRAMMALGLRASGYTVIEAADGEEAVKAGLSQPRPIHLALIDGGTRRMHGIRASFPGVPVIFLVDSAAPLRGPDEDPLAQGTFLPKPFGLRELQALVRDVLDAGAPLRAPIVDSTWLSE